VIISAAFLGVMGLAHAQPRDPLPIHGWVQAEGSADALRAWVGATFPVIPEVTVASGLVATDAWAELQVGSTIEVGVLYLMPLVGPDYIYDTETFGLSTQLYAVVELAGLPFYFQSWFRFGIHSPFGAAADTWALREQVLYTFGQALTAGIQIEGYGEPLGPVRSFRIGLRRTAGLPRHFGVGVFAGIETQRDKDHTLIPDIGLVGRLTVDLSW